MAKKAYRLLRKGKASGIDGFVKLYHPALASIALQLLGNKEESEELVAESFMCLWRKRAGFNGPAEAKLLLFTTVIESCKAKIIAKAENVQPKKPNQIFSVLTLAFLVDQLSKGPKVDWRKVRESKRDKTKRET